MPSRRFRAAAAEAVRQLGSWPSACVGLGRADEAGIFDAQAMMAEDPQLLGEAVARAEAGEDPEAAVRAAAATAAATLASLPDELLASRAADVRDVGARIVRIMTGQDVAFPASPSIAVAEDLPPSIVAEVPTGLLLGVALQGSSPTAHAVILARGLGIPCRGRRPGLVEAAGSATCVAIDGESGEAVLDPDPFAAGRFRGSCSGAGRTPRGRCLPARAPRGNRRRGTVILLANIGGPEEAGRALEAGAEGVGLFRTEFLFMRRQSAPSEDEQVEPYRRVFEAFGRQRPVVVRLADIGGDKAVPYLDLPPQANSFPGSRAVPLAARDRGLLSSQLRAIWRAAGGQA